MCACVTGCCYFWGPVATPASCDEFALLCAWQGASCAEGCKPGCGTRGHASANSPVDRTKLALSSAPLPPLQARG